MARSTSRFSRRTFGKLTAASGAAVAMGGWQRQSFGHARTLRVAFIGVGGRGGANLGVISKQPDVQVVALCDVNGRNLANAQKNHGDAKTFRDFRQLYAELKDYDAVVVSTTEHTHASATLPALKNGKHVYCEKPLTQNVAEARMITQAAQQAGVVTQMGTQIHAEPNYHRVVELIQSGAIGKVTEAHVWVGRAWGLQSEAESKENKDIVYVTERPKESQTPPDYLDWDLWLGPAPERPFHEVYFPGPKWYRWWDFGNGTMSDLGSHWVDLPFWALKLDAPISIEASPGPAHPEIAPASMTAVYEYAARGDMPPCKLTWYQGSHKPTAWTENKIPQWNSGVLFVGSEGMLVSDYGKHLLLPEEKYLDFKRPDKFIADSPGQQIEWVQACQTGSATASPFSYAGLLTEANHLGNVAYRAGSKIVWDSKAMRITNLADANKYLSRTPRSGW